MLKSNAWLVRCKDLVLVTHIISHFPRNYQMNKKFIAKNGNQPTVAFTEQMGVNMRAKQLKFKINTLH